MESESGLNADFKEEYSKGRATKITRILHGSKWEFMSCSAASCRIKRHKYMSLLEKKLRPALGKAGRARTRSGDGRGGDVTGNA
jgi:hypothetical protein